MKMEDCETNSQSIKDFKDRCRICLKNHDDMTDALASGMSNIILEVVNIKIALDDELSKFICQDCIEQIEIFSKFKSLAKDSDNYLRTLLLAEKCFAMETENDNWQMVLGNDDEFPNSYELKKIDFEHDDKMYIIHVNKETEDSDSQNEIFIKDLACENDDTQLASFCRSLVKAKSTEDNSPIEQLENGLCDDPAENLVAERFCNDDSNVDWYIYQCDKCDEFFQSKDYLNEHLKIVHDNEVSMTAVTYECRICAISMDNENIFLEHLKVHEAEDFSYLEIDENQYLVTREDLAEEVFEAPNSDCSVLKNRVFKINPNCYKCFLCERVVPAESISNHLKECFPDFDEEMDYLTFHLKFTCPACFTSWTDDDCENFKQHILLHKVDNIFFIKVNNLGEPEDLTEEDYMFTPFEKALELLNFDEDESGFCKGFKIAKLQNLFSCQICDFETTSVNFLYEHYLEIHGSARSVSYFCSVCYEEFKFLDAHEISKFQSHMINHKEEGICFLKVDSNGAIVNDGPDSSGLFSDVNDLLEGKIQCPEFEFMSSISVPVVFVERTDDCKAGECVVQKEDGAHLKTITKRGNKFTKEYICEKCGKGFFGKVNFKRHFLNHGKDAEASNQKRPKCSVCDKTFSNRAALIEHRKHHSECETDNVEDSAQTICEICGRRLSNNASLAKHRRLHEKESENKLLKCKICGRNFRREAALSRHLSAHLNPNYFECGECKLPLPSLASLERHKLGHQSTANTYDCEVCKVSFLTKDRLTSHETHTGHNQNRKRFECNVCHEKFFIGREFTKHIKLHPKYKMSECALCGKRLSTVQSLMLHLDRHFESNSILCPHCGKQCFEERNYRRHLLTHEGVKPFVCDVEGCDKSFYTYFEIKRHKKYHNNTRDFKCPYCPKSFHEANHLKVHIRTHTGERPYTCPHCNKGFVTRTRCKQHINLVHQGVGYDLIQTSISKKVAVFEAVDMAA